MDEAGLVERPRVEVKTASKRRKIIADRLLDDPQLHANNNHDHDSGPEAAQLSAMHPRLFPPQHHGDRETDGGRKNHEVWVLVEHLEAEAQDGADEIPAPLGR